MPRVSAGQTLLVNGAGTTVGFAAAQIGLQRGARVVATAGDTYAGRLRAMGATVTSYGDGLAGRVTVAAGGPVDLVLDTAPPSGALPDLIQAADGDPRRVLTVSDFAAAAELGVRDSLYEDPTPRHDVLDEFAKLAADGQFTIPVARTFPLKTGARHLVSARADTPAANSSCCLPAPKSSASCGADSPNSARRRMRGRRSSAFSRRLSRKGLLTGAWPTRWPALASISRPPRPSRSTT
jgi:hypothetical protein